MLFKKRALMAAAKLYFHNYLKVMPVLWRHDIREFIKSNRIKAMITCNRVSFYIINKGETWHVNFPAMFLYYSISIPYLCRTLTNVSFYITKHISEGKKNHKLCRSNSHQRLWDILLKEANNNWNLYLEFFNQRKKILASKILFF